MISDSTSPWVLTRRRRPCVIDAIVTRYTEAMVAHHAEAKYPPVRGLKPTVDDPFADLENDLPWETP